MLEYALSAGLQDADAFQSCLDSGMYAGAARGNYELAQSIGLTGRPKFIILKEGHEPALIPGALPYSAFQQILDQMA